MPEPRTVPLEWSRVQATADRLQGQASNTAEFLNVTVGLTGALADLSTPNGRRMMHHGLRLLARTTQHVLVVVPDEAEALRRELEAEAIRIAPPGRLRFTTAAALAECAVVLAVGPVAGPADVLIGVSTDGWLVRLRGDGAVAPTSLRENPATALAAAALGVAEVFKRIVEVKASRGPRIEDLSWSLLTLRTETADPGPDIPPALALDALLVGFGAIGNGVVAALEGAQWTGRLQVLDRQGFGPENLGTCLLLGLADIGQSKATIGARRAQAQLPGVHVSAVIGTLENFVGEVDSGTQPAPSIVIGAVDSPEARRKLQTLWPDVLLDGAIGDFMAQVGVHPAERPVACLQCLYEEPVGEAPEVVAERLTGLARERLAVPEAEITEEDVRKAAEGHHEFLRARVGRKICSVVSEATLAQVSTRPGLGFEPSIPFVACLSAALVVTELVRVAAGWAALLEPRYQVDLLVGPSGGLELPIEPDPHCFCQERAPTIAAVRRARRFAGAPLVGTSSPARCGTRRSAP
jgi:hypothetical protein